MDGSTPSLQAVRWAAGEAARRSTSLLLLHATSVAAVYVGPASSLPVAEEVQAHIDREASAVLAAAQQAAAAVGGIEVRTRVDAESPAVALRQASRSAQALVLGASGRGALGTALGSVTLAAASHAECPVVVVRGDDNATPDRPVLVGVDGGPLSDTALSHAFDAAAARGSSLTALHVWDDNDTQRYHLSHYFELRGWEQMKHREERALAERLAGWSERYPQVDVERRIEYADPPKALVEASTGCGLVVVATRGRGGFAGLLLGSTALALIQLAACPVMLVGPESRPIR